MRYGKISLLTDQVDHINYGDVVQDFACEYLLSLIGIQQEEMIEIPIAQSASYDGEYVIVPIYNAMLDGYYSGEHRFSERIIPVFLGFTTDLACLPNEMCAYLKRYEPIGCRDEYTFRLLRRYGIYAYMGGCITTILPSRDHTPEKPSVFLVDVPRELIPHIPQQYHSVTKEITQTATFPMTQDTQEQRRKIREAARAFYQKYHDEATLVVTSKLHSALPCLAMGIPLILARDEMWKTFTFVDAYTNIYLEEEFGKINWNPEPIAWDKIREQSLQVFKKRLLEAQERFGTICDLSFFYETRNKKYTASDFEERIESLVACIRQNKSQDFKYIIWGAGVRGHMVYARLKNEFPQASFLTYVDGLKQGKLDDVEIKGIDEIERHQDAYIIICNNTGEQEAVEKMEKMGKEYKKDYFSTNKKKDMGSI